MKIKQQIDEEVKKTLNLLDQAENIEVDHFFYTRLQSKLRNKDKKEVRNLLPGFNLSVVRNGLIVFLVLLNLVSGIYVLQSDNDEAGSRDDYISTLTGEYSSEQDIYNYNN